MRRNVIAALVQLVGAVVVCGAAFAVTWPLGVMAIGVFVVALGVGLEGDR
jgi:hypothetical protein